MNMSEPVVRPDLTLLMEERAAQIVASRLATARALGGADAEPQLVAAILAELGAEMRLQQERGRLSDF